MKRHAQSMVPVNCLECGILFVVPAEWNNRKREDGEKWFCPNGHAQFYTGHPTYEVIEDQAAKLREEVEKLKRVNIGLLHKAEQAEARAAEAGGKEA